jgi:uncharacterized UBP type Zn finger protein
MAARRARGSKANGSTAPCKHLDAIRLVVPRSQVCEQCAAEETTWAALRLCLSCGWVACCDGSRGQHAKAHYEETDHAVAAAMEPGSNWRWCYVHRRAV